MRTEPRQGMEPEFRADPYSVSCNESRVSAGKGEEILQGCCTTPKHGSSTAAAGTSPSPRQHPTQTAPRGTPAAAPCYWKHARSFPASPFPDKVSVPGEDSNSLGCAHGSGSKSEASGPARGGWKGGASSGPDSERTPRGFLCN